jgi:hypothetical protein
MAKDWYYAKDGQQRGPFPETHVRQLAASGQILPHDLVWHDGLAEWVAAQSVVGLMPEAGEGTSAAPPGAASVQADAPRAPAGARPRSYGSSTYGAAGSPSEFPPWLAVLLTVGTLGLFSIWYTWRASARYARECGARAVDAQGRPLGRVRHPAWVLLISYATLGVYFCHWVYATLRDCGRYAGDTSRAPSDVTLLIVFPPYAVYCLVFRMPAAIERVRVAAGLAESPIPPSYGFLNPLMFLALPYLAMWYQELLNEAWTNEPGNGSEAQ